MRFEVRNPGGTLYGTVRLTDLSLLRYGVVKFCRARNVRYCGPGLLSDLPMDAIDLSMQSLDMKVSTWAEMPAISEHGGYRPGRIDFVLLWEGPADALREVRGFEPAL